MKSSVLLVKKKSPNSMRIFGPFDQNQCNFLRLNLNHLLMSKIFGNSTMIEDLPINTLAKGRKNLIVLTSSTNCVEEKLQVILA